MHFGGKIGINLQILNIHNSLFFIHPYSEKGGRPGLPSQAKTGLEEYLPRARFRGCAVVR